MDNKRNINNQTNIEYSNNLKLTNISKSKKKKKKYKSYDDFNDINNQKNKEIKSNFINDYQPNYRNFAIIRNSKDIMKYIPKENSKEIDNNYYSLLNDFEVNYPKGNTNFYLIYNDSYRYPYQFNISKYSNIALKSHHSFKLGVNQLMIKNNKKELNYNISKESLPFCIYDQNSSNNAIIKEYIDKYLNNQEYFLYNRRNTYFKYIKNYNKIISHEESKNNDAIMLEDYNNFNPNLNNNNGIREKKIYYINTFNDNSHNKSKESNIPSEKNSENNENSRNRIKLTNTREDNNINEEEPNIDGNIEPNEEKKKETFSTDVFSLNESDDELYNRGDLSTYGIVNILRLPKERKKFNLRLLRQNNKENNDKKNDIKENESKKDEDFIPENKNNNNINIKKTEGSSFHSGKKKIKNVEFLRESLDYFYK